MGFEISISEFNRQFQLYQKGERYNLNLYNLDLNHFLVTFFQYYIEDLKIFYTNKYNQRQYKQTSKYTNFNHFFDCVENLLNFNVEEVEGYFPEMDVYFNCNNHLIEINYIKREYIFDIVDLLLNGMDCNYKSRLKTELLINMEFD